MLDVTFYSIVKFFYWKDFIFFSIGKLFYSKDLISSRIFKSKISTTSVYGHWQCLFLVKHKILQENVSHHLKPFSTSNLTNTLKVDAKCLADG